VRPSQQIIDTPAVDANLLAVLQQEVDLGGDALRRGKADAAVTFFQSALAKMNASFPIYDHVVHNLLTAYKTLIEQLLRTGETDTATGFLNSALSLEIEGAMADDKTFRHRFADTIQNLGLVFFENARMDESIACCRRAISIEPDPTYHVNLNNALALSRKTALLSDFTTEITPEELGRHIFIACVPKSASTFLKNVLENLTGYRELFDVYAAGQNEHDLYLPSLVEYAAVDTVTQQHCRASDANVQMMQGFGIQPIVLVRDVFDSVMSLLDFYRNQGAYFNSYFRPDFPSLDYETQIDLIIENIIPWYFQFVASWKLAEREKRLQVMWLTYEDLITDKAGSITGVLNFYGLGASARDIGIKIKETESEARKNRFNKGVVGRGSIGISDTQKERIRHYAKYYPSTDFRLLGL
jgi:tetratricopeptide (TPR) repeat protein